jgi:hypothetical protein
LFFFGEMKPIEFLNEELDDVVEFEEEEEDE